MAIALKSLVYKTDVKIAIFENNKLSDKSMAILLKGLKSRKEWILFSSVQNEIGELSTKQIMKII